MPAALMSRPPLSARGPRERRLNPRSRSTSLAEHDHLAHQTRSDGRIPPNPRAFTGSSSQSPSPRPPRWRPVDAVELAKRELAQGVPGKVAKLRLTALTARDDDEEDALTLHEGFYSIAASVVKPQISARQHAVQLQEDFEGSLRFAKQEAEGISVAAGQVASTAEANADTIAQDPRLSDAISAQKEAEVCMAMLVKYICSTSTESRERGALLNAISDACTSSLTRLHGAVGSSVVELQEAKERQQVLEKERSSLEDDNASLRHILQQMLATEGGLRKEREQLRQQTAHQQQEIERLEQTMQDKVDRLSHVEEELRLFHDDLLRGRATRDACNSPMMGFAAFVTSAEPGYYEHEPPNMPQSPDSGAGPGTHEGRKRTWSTSSQKVPNKVVEAVADPRQQAVGAENAPQIRQSFSRSPPGCPGDSVSVGEFNRLVTSPSPGPGSDRASRHPAAAQDEDDDGVSRKSYMPSSAHTDTSMEEPQQREPSPLATDFPGLLPFLDLAAVDPELEQSKVDAISQNHEHLEKHLVMLRAEHGEEERLNTAMQKAVDTTVERLMLWLQAVHDSLRTLSTATVQQEMSALDIFRGAMEWLGKRSCKEWSEPPELLEEVLDEHEVRLREILARERETDVHADELRRELARQRHRVEELSEQLRQARSSLSPSARGHRAGGKHVTPKGASLSTPAAIGSPTANAQTQVQQASVGIQCDSGMQCDQMTPGVAEPEQQSGRASSRIDSTARGSRSGGGTAVDGGESPEAHSPETAAEGTAAALAPVQRSKRSSSVSEGIQDTSDSARLAAPTGADIATVPAVTASPGVLQPAVLPAPALTAVDAESVKQRLLSSSFVEAIDLTAVPSDGQLLLMTSANGDVRPNPVDGAPACGNARGVSRRCSAGGVAATSEIKDERLLGIKQLHVFIADVYAAKRQDDARRDKMSQARRPLHFLIQELLRHKHGVKGVVHQKSWQLVESLMQHATADLTVLTFSEFLDGSRDVQELSFYLYCASLLCTTVAEDQKDAQIAPSGRLHSGYASLNRARRMADLLFGDLPKALSVVMAELEKHIHLSSSPTPTFAAELGGVSVSSYFAEYTNPTPLIALERVHQILLEGWRMSSLLLDNSVTGFSWRSVVLAFIQADLAQRGWLDPHEVKEAEVRRLREAGRNDDESLRILDRTSLGAFVFRAVHKAQREASGNTHSPGGVLSELAVPKPTISDDLLQVGIAAFWSIEPCLEVYLPWLLHSEQLRDLAMFHSLKARLYSFRQASSAKQVGATVHDLRCLLLLLLAHQFDLQLLNGVVSMDYLRWELQCLLCIIRESWRRGASSGIGPEFGPELESCGVL